MSSFKIKDHEQIQIIKQLGIRYVHVNPSRSSVEPLQPKIVQEEEIESAVQLEVKKLWDAKQDSIEKLAAYRRRIQQCEKEFEQSVVRMKTVMNNIRSRPKDSIADAWILTDNLVEKLLCDKNVTLHLMNGNSKFEDIYFHSLNVALISMMVAKVKGYDAETIKQLAFAALFHDMGKVKIPAAIVRKKGVLTEPECNYLKLHVKYGLDLADTIEDLPELVKIVIAQHHECNDGSGYPNGLKKEDINELAQIVIVANQYDILCHSNNPADQKLPFAALSYLFKHCKHLYNADILTILVKFMGVYPPGTIVTLSNGAVGVVISVNSNSLLHPNVLIYDPSVPRIQAPIIELGADDLTILNAVNINKLPEEVREYLNPRARISYFIGSDE
jgi:putative nucleotidyltransferase with HDIG domain